MIFEKEFIHYGFDDIVAYSGNDITEEMIDESFKVSQDFFEDEFQINESKIKDIIKKVGQICFIIKDKSKNKVIGYSFWVPIKVQVFTEFIKNKKMLMFIEEEHLSKFNEPVVNLFQAGEAFVAGYDLDTLHKALEDIFQSKILVLAQNGVKIGYIAIEAVCKYDEDYLVKQLGLKRKVDKDNSKFYCDKYSPKTTFARSRYAGQLIEYYKD